MFGLEEIIENLKLKTTTALGGVPPLAGKIQDGIFVYLPEISDFKKQEIAFHDEISSDEEEIYQLHSLRNRYYHQYFKKWLYRLPKNSMILEIGAGSGHDLLPLLKRGYDVVACDINFESIKALKAKIENSHPHLSHQIIYLVADGQNLPFDHESFEAVFLVATLHHFENQNDPLQAIKKITKKGGLIILAMEPSKFMMRFTKLFSKFQNLRIYSSHSVADETHGGYSKKNLQSLITNNQLPACRQAWRITTIKRVWLTLGFLHYGLEAIFRLLKLKKRIRVPKLIEWIFLIFDEFLLKIPFINKLNWHWTVVLKKV